MTKEQAKKLRDPFKPEQIGKLPKAGIMLDYVGHAATTDRLLQVDPDWTWKPMGLGPNGEPLMTNGGMWIELTVCGVTRPGFGDGKNPKEIIGDAIRNAAMRFGVALDLWAKEDLGGGEAEGGVVQATSAVGRGPKGETSAPTSSSAPAEKSDPLSSQEPERPQRTQAQNRKFNAILKELNDLDGQDWKAKAKAYCVAEFGKESSTELNIDEMSTVIDEFEGQRLSLLAAREADTREAEALPFG